MSKPRVGKILDPDFNPTRDAIHVPILPVIAANEVRPGQRLIIQHEGNMYKAYAWNDLHKTALAIVDPFLREIVPEGALFYAWITPGIITELWHEWTLFAIDKQRTKDIE